VSKDASRAVTQEKEISVTALQQNSPVEGETNGSGGLGTTLAEFGFEDIDLSFLEADNGKIELLRFFTSAEISPTNSSFESLSQN
jgi:fructose-specific phosphotransferase system component IIB